jgi:hypothetical protein
MKEGESKPDHEAVEKKDIRIGGRARYKLLNVEGTINGIYGDPKEPGKIIVEFTADGGQQMRDVLEKFQSLRAEED